MALTWHKYRGEPDGTPQSIAKTEAQGSYGPLARRPVRTSALSSVTSTASSNRMPNPELNASLMFLASSEVT